MTQVGLRAFLVVAFAATLVACAETKTAPPKVTALQQNSEAIAQRANRLDAFAQDYDRLVRIAQPLFIAAAGFCPDRVIPDLGIAIWNLDLMVEPGRGELLRRHLLRPGLILSNVVPNAVAARAGLKRKDRLISVGGLALKPGTGAVAGLDRRMMEVLPWGRPVAIQIEREGAVFDFKLRPEARCHVGLMMRPGGEGEILLDGKNILIDRALLRAQEDDQQLAVLLAHALAHHVMGHTSGGAFNATVGLSAGPFYDVAAGAFDRTADGNKPPRGLHTRLFSYFDAQEREADYVGAYIMALAGYPLQDLGAVWRGLSEKGDLGEAISDDHPLSSERLVGLELVVQEIEERASKGEALLPRGLEGLNAALFQEPRDFAAALDNAVLLQEIASPDRWQGAALRDACGVAWEMSLTLDKGELTGSIARGEIVYDVFGGVSADGRSLEGRAGRNEASANKQGPRLLSFELAMAPSQAEGVLAVESSAGRKCITPITLVKLQ